MNEKEIINEIKSLSPSAEACDGILDLYNKEKEKNEELEEYKKISELTKISCCTAQNCGALSNAIREGLENQKLREQLEEREARLQEEINENCKLKAELYGNSISKDKIREKIKQINDEKLNYSENEYYLENEIKGYAIDKLRELLEEE